MLALLLAKEERACAGDTQATSPSPLLEGIEVDRDLIYAEAGTARLALDLYRPRGYGGARPVLLFIHGGGWVMGSKADAVPELETSAAGPAPRLRQPSMLPFVRRGLALVSIDYRLARQAAAPAAVEDCLRALAWLGSHGRARGLDARRVVVIGASAGGHLALMLALVHGQAGTPFTRPPGSGAERVTIVGAVDLYGITDVLDVTEGPHAQPWAQQWVPDGPDRAARAGRVSPLAYVRARLPPILIVHSPADEVVPYAHSVRLYGALRGVGARGKLVTIPRAVHGFFTDAQLAVLERDIGAFLRRLGLFDK